MKILKTTSGLEFTLDDEDFEFINQWQWHITERGYIYRPQRKENGEQGSVVLHIEILKRMGFNMENCLGDHKDRNKYNNCRYNLRPSTKSQNGFNSKIKSNNTLGYKGMYYDKRRNCYYTSIMVNGQRIFLGKFKDIKEAAIVYNQAAIKYHGEFAVLNVV